MTEERKKRLWQLVKPVGQVLLLGIAYFVFIKLTNWAIPCPIHLVTGKYCPGCGISRMILAMFRLDFETAFHANRLLFFLLPVILIYAFIKGVYYVVTGKNNQSRAEQCAVLVLCIITIAFWIMRNTERFSYMAPMG